MTSPGLSNQPNLLLISLSCDLSSPLSLDNGLEATLNYGSLMASAIFPDSFFLLMLFLPSLGELICSCVFSYCQYGDDSSLTQTSFLIPDPYSWMSGVDTSILCFSVISITRPQVQLTLFLFLLFPIFFLDEWPHPFNCLGEKILCHPRLLLLYHPSSQIILHLLPLDYKLFFSALTVWYNVLAFLIWP